MRSKNSRFHVRRGSSLVEYGILAGLVSATAIVAVLTAGQQIGDTFDTTNEAIAQDTPVGDPSGAAAFEIFEGQSYSFPLDSGPGQVVGRVLTGGGSPVSFQIITGGEGLAIDNGGNITVSDAETFGPGGTTSSLTIETVDDVGAVDRGQVMVTRRPYEDVPGDESTWAYIYPNIAKTSTFEATNDHDWFKLEIDQPGQSLSLQIKNHDGDNGRAYWFDTIFADANGDPIDFVESSNHAVTFVQDVPPGEYFVQVMTPDAPGDYEIFAEVGPDDRPGFGDAIDVTPDTPISSYNMASETGDMYRFSLASSSDLKFFMARDDRRNKGMWWPEIIIYDGNQNQIATDKDGHEAYHLIENAPAGDYYILALSDNYQVSGDYLFEVKPVLDAIEATFEDAAELQPNISSYSNYTREESGDMWRLQIGEHSDIQFVMVADDSNGEGLSNTVMTIYDAARTELAEVYRANENKFVMNDLPAGTYYILASARNYYDGDYRIAANQVDDIPGSFENATPIPANYSGAGNYTVGEDGDMYRITLSEVADFGVNMTSQNAVWPYIRIYDASQAQIASSTGTADEASVSIANLAAGTYYILMTNNSRISGSYSMTTAASPASP